MSAARQPAQDIFRTDNCKGEGLCGAVEGGKDHGAAILEQGAARTQEQRPVGHMLHHFHIENGVETLPGLGQGFDRAVVVIDNEAALFGVGPGNTDVFFPGVEAGDLRA